MCLCILISYFLLISFQSLPLANGTRVEENCQQTSQSFLDSSPFFRMAPSRFQSQQILFLTEFSRFMNRHAPTMMKVSTSPYSNISNVSSFHQSSMKKEPQMHAGGSGVKRLISLLYRFQEFVGKKQIYQAERTLQKLKRYNPETVLNELGDEVEARTTPPVAEEVEPV